MSNLVPLSWTQGPPKLNYVVSFGSAPWDPEMTRALGPWSTLDRFLVSDATKSPTECFIPWPVRPYFKMKEQLLCIDFSRYPELSLIKCTNLAIVHSSPKETFPKLNFFCRRLYASGPWVIHHFYSAPGNKLPKNPIPKSFMVLSQFLNLSVHVIGSFASYSKDY